MKYKRILLKLSGEALAGERQGSIDPEIAKFIAAEIKEIQDQGIEVAVVLGGGNFYRGGPNFKKDGIKEETSHYMGMLAICLNGLAFSDLLTSFGVENKVLSALGKVGKMDNYDIETGKEILQSGKVLLLAGGTGKPFCSSDSGAAIRAEELDIDVIFKATKVDGIYDCDPVTNLNAQKFDIISFDEVLKKDLKVMDRGAFEKCQKNGICIVVFKMEKGNIKKAVMGEKIGTIVQ